jgi:hypothetical protein
MDIDLFGEALLRAAALAGEEWDLPSEDLESWVLAPLPDPIKIALGGGLREGSLTIDGTRFRLRDLPPTKGPYTLFTRHPTRLTPNVEYFVQTAEFLRLNRALAPHGFSVGFEDLLMDVTVRREGRLLWFIEAKDTSDKLDQLLAGMRRYAEAVPVAEPDRGNDGLRKSKYLIEYRPPFFSTIAVGRRDDFAVGYPSRAAFWLRHMETEPGIVELSSL